jgi:hypothetical protein
VSAEPREIGKRRALNLIFEQGQVNIGMRQAKVRR